MDPEKRTLSFASGKADPGTRPGIYVDPDVDGVLISVSDGVALLQMVLTPEEARQLAATIYGLAKLHVPEVSGH